MYFTYLLYFQAELLVSTICWRRVNNEFLSGTRMSHDFKYGKKQINSKINNLLFPFHLKKKKNTLHAHVNTYSDGWMSS